MATSAIVVLFFDNRVAAGTKLHNFGGRAGHASYQTIQLCPAWLEHVKLGI